jgi:hypothetical protein
LKLTEWRKSEAKAKKSKNSNFIKVEQNGQTFLLSEKETTFLYFSPIYLSEHAKDENDRYFAWIFHA